MFSNLNFFYFILYFLFCTAFISFLFLLSYFIFLKKKNKSIKKKSLYECGFESINNSKNIIDIQYINIALLFIIFDLEIIFILPWIISANFLGLLGSFTIYILLVFVVYGFLYELLIGALNWNNKKYMLKP